MKMEVKMRRIILLLLSIVIASAAQAQSNEKPGSEVTVSATSSVSAEPEIAEFRISIIARHAEATNAFGSYVRTYDALEKALKAAVAPGELKTDNLTVTPFFDYKKPDKVTPEYYQVRATMSLSVPIPDLNKTLGSVASVEGVTVDGIQFRVKDEEKLETDALKLAVRQAREKAEAIAKLEGLSDLKVKTLNTNTTPPPVMPMFRAMSVESAAPSLNASSVSVSATVNVTYTASSK